MKSDMNLEKMQDGKIEPKNNRKMMSKDNSEQRQVEKESIKSEDMQKKRIDKKKKKQNLMMMIQQLKPDNHENSGQSENMQLNMPRQEQFSFDANISGGPNIEIMRQASFQPTNLNNESNQPIQKKNEVSFDKTFKKIAQSLSPEPEKLIQSQLNSNDKKDKYEQ